MGARFLVVNDDKQVKTYLSRILSKVGGFSVEVAETGGEALQIDLDDMIARLRKVLFRKKSFLSIKNYPQKCLFGWEKIKEMKDNQNEFWAGERFTRLRIVDVGRRDRSICMITREGKKTWPLDFQNLKGAHNRIHCQDKALLAHEIDRYIPAWGNYIWGLLEYLGCNKVLIQRSIFLDDALEDRRSFPSCA